MKKQKELLFLKKKQQKNFIPFGSRWFQHRAKRCFLVLSGNLGSYKERKSWMPARAGMTMWKGRWIIGHDDC
jgi:hypothetical protein